MIGERNVAMLAAGCPTTFVALHLGGKTAAVEKQDGLLAVLQRRLHGAEQLGRKSAGHHLAVAKVLDVDNLDDGQLHMAVSLRELHKSVAPLLGEMIALHTGRGSSHEGAGMELAGEHQGGAAGVIARGGVLLLVAAFVFFVNNNKTQLLEWKEHAGTHTHDDVVGVVAELLLPNFHTLGIGIFAVVDAQAVAEHASEALHKLGGEHDFGQQV